MTKSLLSKAIISKENTISITASGLVVLLLLLTINLRPAILGQVFGAPYSGFLVYFLILITIWINKIQFNQIKSQYISSAVVIALYVFFQILFVGYSSVSGAIGTLIYMLIGFVLILIIDYDTARNFSKLLIGLCVFFGVSYLVSYTIFFLSGNSYTAFTINLETHTDYVYKLEVLFPFSPVYNGTANVAGLKLPRAIGMMREPGLYQMVIIISYWLQDFYKFKYNTAIKSILVFSLIVTFSTTGYALLLGTVMWKMFKILEQNKVRYLLVGIPLMLLLLYGLIFSESQFGIMEKLDSQSGSSRLGATLISLEIIRDNPLFGIGFHVEPSDIEIGINYLGTIAQLGIIGALIFLLPTIYTWTKIKNAPVQVINIFFVLVFTMFFAQPIYDKSLTYVFLSILLVIGVESKRTFVYQKYILKPSYAS